MLFTSEVIMLTLLLAASPDFELRRTFLSCRALEHKDTFGGGSESQFSAELSLVWHLMCLFYIFYVLAEYVRIINFDDFLDTCIITILSITILSRNRQLEKNLYSLFSYLNF